MVVSFFPPLKLSFAFLCDLIDKYILILEVIIFQRLIYLVLFQRVELGSLGRSSGRLISNDCKQEFCDNEVDCLAK